MLFDRPNAEKHADNGRNDERYEDDNPQVVAAGHAIAQEELKHEQYEMQRETRQHRFELDVGVTFVAVLRIFDEYDCADEAADYHE